MPPFEVPDIPVEKSTEWIKTAKRSFPSPELLKLYQQRFNTITIPLLSQDAFFTDAIAAARHAESRNHLEQLLEQKREERLRGFVDLTKSFADAYMSPQGRPLSERTRAAAIRVGQTGSLEHLLQFVSCVVFGWGAVEEADDSLEKIAGHVLHDDTAEAGAECETQILPQAHFPLLDIPEDTGLH